MFTRLQINAAPIHFSDTKVAMSNLTIIKDEVH